VSRDIVFAFVLNPRSTTELENAVVFLVAPLLFMFEDICEGPFNLLRIRGIEFLGGVCKPPRETFLGTVSVSILEHPIEGVSGDMYRVRCSRRCKWW